MSKENGNGKANGKPKPLKRGEAGKFIKGTRGGPGNPYAKKVHGFRSFIMRCTSEEDFREIWEGLIEEAKKREQWAVREFFDRTIGKANQPIDLTARKDADEMGDDLVEFLRSRTT